MMKRVIKKGSIATNLMKRVFGIYFIIAILITASHLILEYYYQKNNIIQDLKDLEQTFHNSIAVHLWDLNEEALGEVVNGMINLDVIEGVIIQNQRGDLVAISGIVNQRGVIGDVKPNIKLLGLSSEEIVTSSRESYQYDIFKHQFSVSYYQNNQKSQLGTVTLFSNRSVVFRRIKLGFFLLIINAFIKTLFLGLLFLWFAKRIIRKPLNTLAESTIQLTLDNLHSFELNLNVSGNNELTTIEHSFNKMVYNLNHSNKRLKEAQRLIVDIIDSMPSIIIGIDQKMIIHQWNKHAQEISGISYNDATGKHLFEFFPELDLQKKEIEEAIEYGKNSLIKRFRHIKDKKTYYEDITIFPLHSNGSEVMGVVIRIDDVTKECKLETQLSHSRKMDAIGQLAGGVAHDFNNMLGGIVGAAQLLKLPQRGLDEKGEELVEMIMKASSRAADLTSKLLLFGRKGSITFEVVDINQVFDDVYAIFNRTIDKKITINMVKNAENSSVIGDGSTLQNVIMNLGINAVHAMLDGGDLLIETRNIYLNKLYCSSSSFDLEPGNYIEIEVRDTGEGIPRENIDSIFDPFFTTKEQGKGTGLGLSMVYGTVCDHHGAITLYSEVGEGTVFYIYLPCTKMVNNSPQKVIANEEMEAKGSGTILLVDDEEIIRITSKKMLEDMGYDLLVAKNGLEATEIFKESHHKIDLVLMDMIMPKMGGYDAFLKMKEISPDCKIIIASGFSKDDSLYNLRKRGLSGFIRKPYKTEALSTLLNDLLSS